MSQWIAVIGSPRKGKNTDLLTDYIIEGLKEKDIKVKKYFIGSSNISTCTGCGACIKEGVCRIQDDLTEILEHMKEAEGYIFASPSYNYNMTAQMKALIDRTFCLNDYTDGWKSRLSAGKKAMVVGVCAGKTKEAMGYTLEGMSKPLEELGVEIIDVVEYYDTKHLPAHKQQGVRENIMARIKGNKALSL